MEEFKVNDYITLKLENGRTNIYIKGDDYPFEQCKYLLMRKTANELEDFLENIQSVDELAEKLDKSLEGVEPELIDIPAETRFWAHCSNMQVWAENNYDTKLLHSNLAFPLLKELIKVGDPMAKRIFKEVIVKRFLEGPQKIREFLCSDEGYMDILTKEERRVLFNTEIEFIEELEREIQNNSKYYFRQFKITVSRLESLPNSIMWKDGKVIGINIDLSYININEIPELLKRLKYLETLIIEGAKNEGVPDWVSELKLLKRMDLTLGKLMSLPEWIVKLKHLEHLNVYHNQIEYVPDSIEVLNSLKYLNLSDNNISTISESIGNLTSLEYLNVGGNKLELIPKSIGNLKAIKKLLLGENLLESIPDSIGDLRSLKQLELGANKLKYLPKSVFKIETLEEIYLSSNPLEDIPKEVINLPLLKRLWLTKTKISEDWYMKNRLEEKGIKVYLKS